MQRVSAIASSSRLASSARVTLPRSIQTPRIRQTIITHAKIQSVSAEELEQAITERTTPLIIDFYATWCGPCALLAKELERVAEKYGDKIRILKIDTDEHQQLASQLQIYGLPTVIFVSTEKDKPALRTEGMLPAETIMEIVEKELLVSSS